MYFQVSVNYFCPNVCERGFLSLSFSAPWCLRGWEAPPCVHLASFPGQGGSSLQDESRDALWMNFMVCLLNIMKTFIWKLAWCG